MLFLPCSLVANNACLLFIVQQQDVNRLSTCGNEKLLSENLQLQLFSSWVTIIVSLFNSPQKLTYAGQPYLTFTTTKNIFSQKAHFPNIFCFLDKGLWVSVLELIFSTPHPASTHHHYSVLCCSVAYIYFGPKLSSSPHT